jgi:hypothetical protein
MIKKWAISLLVVLTIAGIGAALFLWFRPKLSPSPVSRLAEEQEVYSVVLADFDYQVEEYTTIGLVSDDLQGYLAHAADEIPGLKKETMLDFQNINEQAYLLKDYLPSINDDILLSANDMQQLPEDDGWIALSRVGFNSRLTQALVLLGHVAKIDGDVFICNEVFKSLKKVDNVWVAEGEVWVIHCELPPS